MGSCREARKILQTEVKNPEWEWTLYGKGLRIWTEEKEKKDFISEDTGSIPSGSLPHTEAGLGPSAAGLPPQLAAVLVLL